MNADPPEGPLPRVSRPWAYRPFAQLAANVDCALLIARSEPIADASLPEMRARSRPGTAIAAMMPMIAMTISSSMRVKPFWLRMLTWLSFRIKLGRSWRRPSHEQGGCRNGLIVAEARNRNKGRYLGTWFAGGPSPAGDGIRSDRRIVTATLSITVTYCQSDRALRMS